MEKKANKATIWYHRFFVYLPPILIIFLISMIYVSYWVNYLAPLLLDYNTEKEALKTLIKYPFELSSSPQTSFSKGLILAVFTSLFLIILLISLFRTIFSDPGSFPNPLDLEFQIVMKNLLHEQQQRTSTETLNTDMNEAEKEEKNNIRRIVVNNNDSQGVFEKEIFKINRNKKKNINKKQNTHDWKKKNFVKYNKKEAEIEEVLEEYNDKKKFSSNSSDYVNGDCYYNDDSFDKVNENTHINLAVDFRNTIESAPICYEEYRKKTILMENWQYKLPLSLRQNDAVQDDAHDNAVANIEQTSCKLKKTNLNQNENGNIHNNNMNKNKNSYLSMENSATKNFSNRNLLEFEIEAAAASDRIKVNKNNPKYSNNENDKNIHNAYANANLNAIESVFDPYIGYDVGKAFLCGNCVRLKIERSHHCKQCGKCILKMDHHCPWLANCIGYSNYKFFLLSHLYGMLACLMVLGSYWETVFNNIFDYESTVIILAWNLFVYVNAVGLFAFLVWLFAVNWTLMFQGLTVIENADRERFPNAKFANTYDLGYYKNFICVFGESPFIWLLPIMPNDKYKGIYFEKNSNKDNKMMSYI